jgi:hypothetical protein
VGISDLASAGSTREEKVMAEKRFALALISPSVDVRVSDYGSIGVTLEGWKKKRGGDEDLYTIEFTDITEQNLACIARSATSALRRLRKVQDLKTRQLIERATGWNEPSVARD